MFELHFTDRFYRDAKRCKRLGLDMRELEDVFRFLKEDGMLPESYSPHLLHDEWNGYWEAHIDTDWLIVWRREGNKVILLAATGSHQELFG